jgi:hypothetical protein
MGAQCPLFHNLITNLIGQRKVLYEIYRKRFQKILGSLEEYLKKREYIWKPIGAKKFFTARYYMERRSKHYLSGYDGSDYYIILYRGRDIDDSSYEKAMGNSSSSHNAK